MGEEWDRGWGLGKRELKGRNPLMLKMVMEMEVEARQMSRERSDQPGRPGPPTGV